MPRKEIDWEAIELAYRAGVLSTREIAAKFEVSHTLINRKAKAGQWDRDLSAKIMAKAEAIVSKQGVSTEVSTETEQQTISANADLVASVLLTQRKDIRRSRTLVMALFEELELQTSNVDLLKDLAALMLQDGGEAQDKRNELFNKVISLQSRSTTVKTLTESLKNLVAMERQAFNVDDGTDTEKPASISITF